LKIKGSLSKDEWENADGHTIPSPVLLSGTEIMTGEGKYVVLVVGKYSCSGKIKEKLA